jgi:hypothetical protein
MVLVTGVGFMFVFYVQRSVLLLTYAGPEPLRAVMVSMSDSGTLSHVPTASSSRRVMASSSDCVDDPHTKTEAPFLTRTGVLGITRITFVAGGKACMQETIGCSETAEII